MTAERSSTIPTPAEIDAALGDTVDIIHRVKPVYNFKAS
jgi:hypothetical protein